MRGKKNDDPVWINFPELERRVGVSVTIEYKLATTIIADNDADYRAQMAELKRDANFVFGNYIEVKKIVGVLIPVKTKNL